jgi:hypothetical protein
MHRTVRALSRGLVLIGELNASGPSNVVQLAKRTGLNRTTCYRLLDTLREDGYVTFDHTNAVFGLTPRVRTLSEGVSSRDLLSQAALPAMFVPTRPGLMAERFRSLRTRFGVDPGEYPPLQSILDSSIHDWPQAVAGAQRAWESHLGSFPTDVTPRNA